MTSAKQDSLLETSQDISGSLESTPGSSQKEFKYSNEDVDTSMELGALSNLLDKIVEKGKKERNLVLDMLSKKLTVNEASSLVARIHSRTNMSKSDRFGMYPIKDWGAFARMKQMESALWVADKIEFTQDINDFNELTKQQQRVLLMSFGFFAVGDGSVASMLAYQMILTADTFEKAATYIVQLDNERTHAETYGKMIFTLVPDPKERKKIFEAVENVKSIKRMNEFIEKAFTHPKGKKHLYVTLVLVEVLMFTPQFSNIFWFRNYLKGKLKMIIFSNEEIAKDECNHGANGIANYLELPKEERYKDKDIHKIFQKVVNLVFDFIDETFQGFSLEGLGAKEAKGYAMYVADDLLARLQHKKLYNVANPLVWMDLTSLIPKTNFYSGKVGEYSRLNVVDSIKKAKELCDGNIKVVDRRSIVRNVSSMKF